LRQALIGGIPPADLQGEGMPGIGTSTFIDPDLILAKQMADW